MSYAATATEFIKASTDSVLGALTASASDKGFYSQIHTQTDAWRVQIPILQSALQNFPSAYVILEYSIPRRGKRIDVIALIADIVFVIEFKVGAKSYDRVARDQTEDYCLDLRDFHHGSRGTTIVPILVATESSVIETESTILEDCVKPLWKCGGSLLAEVLSKAIERYTDKSRAHIEPEKWKASSYSPTPTIIQAAQHLYAGMNVNEIARHHAGPENLGHTTDRVIEEIKSAQRLGKKTICFVTGVPGAGKTLAGLNIVHNSSLHQGDLGVFLSGNGPLVKVLREALARDKSKRGKIRLAESKRRVSTFIQNVHHFLDEYYEKKKTAPPDHVVVFDEAQRAWNKEQNERKFKRPFSEPELMLEVMDRHSDWAVIVALVGCGQEINSGEAGLSEWGRALRERPHWNIVTSSRFLTESTNRFDTLFENKQDQERCRTDDYLDLAISLRSIHAEKLNDFVRAVLCQQPTEAAHLSNQLGDFQICATRSLSTARAWLKQNRRGLRRSGLIASSGARRLRGYGLDVTLDLDVENWFLNPAEDVRSSSYLEVPATEFGIQGLELDWTGVCWGGDLLPTEGGWECRRFAGTVWQSVKDENRRDYLLNKYRVLLTRARSGMILWIPEGKQDDETLRPEWFNRIAKYLGECGVSFV